MGIQFENIVPWNGASDTGRDVRMKWERNFGKVSENFSELEDWINLIVEELKNFLRKDRPDETNFLIKFFGGLLSNYIQSINYSSGALGEGFLIKVDPKTGKSYIEVDELFVRIKAMFTELEIKKLSYAGGNYMFTAAGMKCGKVEEYEGFWRCYLLVDDGETAIENPFRTDDMVTFRDFNIKPGVYENVSNRYYWRLCVGVGDDYIDLSKTDCDANSDVPREGDSLVQLGNRTDKKRQNAITLSVYGDDAPSIHQYAGINSYSLAGKEVTVISPNGNRFTGDFVLKTGVNVLTQFQMLEDLIHSEISKVYDDVQTKDNYLFNSAFASNTDGWITTNKVRFFTVNGKFLFFNDNFYSRKDAIAAVVRYDNRNVLRITASGIRQLNDNLANKPIYVDGETAGKFFISFRCKVITAGTLTVGFPDQDLYFTERLEPGKEYVLKEYSGTWNGTGDFELKFTGEIYLYSLALARNGLSDLYTELSSKIEQTSETIRTEVREMSEANGEKFSQIEQRASNIELSVKKVDGDVAGINGDITNLGIRIDGVNNSISAVASRTTALEQASAGWITATEGNRLWAKKTLEDGNTLISYINQTAGSTTIHSSKINLEGAVTITALDNELKTKVNNFVSNSDLGSLAFKDAVEAAQLGSTIVIGGYLNTDLIKVRRIDADAGFIGGFTLENGRLIWTRSDYFGGTSRSLKLGSGTSKEGVVNVTFNAATDGRFGVAAMGANIGGSAAIYGSSNMYSPNYPDNYVYAGFFDGNVRVLGDITANGFYVKGSDGEYLPVLSDTWLYGLKYSSSDLTPKNNVKIHIAKGLIVGMERY